MTTPDNFAAEPEHYLPQEVDEFNTICKHILRNELAAARKILDRRMRDGVAEQSNAADMIAEERDAWEKRAKALEADNAALRQDAERYREVTKRVQAWPPHVDGTSIWVLEWEGPRAKSFAESVDAAMREGKG